ncbi:MAG: HAMP domain-containing histidine kinase, partial [Elusimicrobia bacterium]|nr:HAMP domain-containing histidine kinase [Elusimicrobiota bacterium]
AAYREAALRESLSWVRDWADRRQRLALLLGSAAAVLAAVLSAAALLRPLGRLAEAAGRVAAGDFTGRVPENSSDELALVSREFNRMTDRLAELDELKAGFVTRVTHDLRAPLSGILGQADMLLGGYKGKLSGQQEESLRSMLRSGKELAELIDNIIDVTRLEAGALKLEPGPIDVEEAIGSALETHQARAAQLRVTVSSHRQPELELVRADPQALRRVLDNLLSNALKFTPAGGAVSLSARRDNHREAVFSVSDTGPGVPEHRLGDLFKKFSQVPETAKRSRGHPGSGLGLAICRELVEAQGGRIWAESRPGEGARFSFTLPLEAGG